VLSGAPAFSVSANAVNPTATPVRFGDLHPGNPAQLITFSAQRLFAAPGSRAMDVTFRVPGKETQPACRPSEPCSPTWTLPAPRA
jgi:hypothetical protein